jgi:Cu+-exporting ATPase
MTEREVNVMATDPVCKMQLNEKKAAATHEYEGKTYYFCAVGCKDKFCADPERFLAQEKKQQDRR